jgi:benzoyl-CoA reductase subunit A
MAEYGRWPEASWTSDTIDWKSAKNIAAGVDVGTTSTQAVIFIDGELFGYSSMRTGADFKTAAGNALTNALGSTGLKVENIESIAATGFGRKRAAYATKQIDEISSIAKGARYLFGTEVKTVVDIGGQSTKAISLYEWDRVKEFKINDKCATGMGRGIETAAEIFRVPIIEMGERSLQGDNDPEPVSTTCYNFAYPEAVGLLRQGYKEDMYHESDALAAYLFAISWRIMSTIGKLAPLDIGDIVLEKEIAFTGGLAKNPGITKRLERDLNMRALTSDLDPQLAGAIGAALLA